MACDKAKAKSNGGETARLVPNDDGAETAVPAAQPDGGSGFAVGPVSHADHRAHLDGRGVSGRSRTQAQDAVELIAEIFVEDMLRLEREHGLKPRELLAYYKGDLKLKESG